MSIWMFLKVLVKWFMGLFSWIRTTLPGFRFVTNVSNGDEKQVQNV